MALQKLGPDEAERLNQLREQRQSVLAEAIQASRDRDAAYYQRLEQSANQEWSKETEAVLSLAAAEGVTCAALKAQPFNVAVSFRSKYRLKDAGLILTQHARERKEERGVTPADMMNGNAVVICAGKHIKTMYLKNRT
jgi:hypothetical protein